MNIAFRVDASTPIGTGHIMRCLTLADALSARKVVVRFLSRHMPRHIRDILLNRGHEFVDLGSAAAGSPDELPHSQWLGTSQAADAAATAHALSDRIWDWMIVDSYALDFRWESALRQVVRRIASIDDIANRRHDCDLLLDQNLHADMHGRYEHKVPPHCQMLLGPRFALLRREFQQLRERVKPRAGPVKRILIFFGGMDADNYTGMALEALTDLGIPEIEIDVVIGETHPARSRLAAECIRLGFVLHVQTDRMAELMAAADLAIGAGGTATWERCCMGLPALVICIADNQSGQIADAAGAVMVYAPDAQEGPAAMMARHVRALIDNSSLRAAISRNGMEAVDGCGAARVVDSMGSSGIQIRRATTRDSHHVFEWRNDPAVRLASRSDAAIDWTGHEEWFAAALRSPDRLLLIGERDGSAVGVVRFDLSNDEAEISIYLVPGDHPRGQGRQLLLAAEAWLADNRPRVAQIRAHVLGENLRSQRLFAGANYRVESACYLKRLH
jgi:UDP-2,4-diacetamido-2,4,6-trideoxy-beta-L-altropyranose hydrolase